MMPRISSCIVLALFAFLGGTTSAIEHEFCDGRGHANLEFALGSLNEGRISLPLKIIFNAANTSNLILPSHWSIPLLESKIQLINEETCRVDFPDGEMVELSAVPGTSEFVNTGAGVTATVENENVVKVRRDKDVYTFKRGLLRTFSPENAPVLTWEYKPGETMPSRISKAGVSLLDLRQEHSGMEYKLHYTFANGRSGHVDYDNLPPSMVELMAPAPGDVIPGMRVISSPEMGTVKFTTRAAENGSAMEALGQMPTKLAWGKDGILQSCNGETYSVIFGGDPKLAAKAGSPCIVKCKDGEQTLVQCGLYEWQPGVMRRFDGSGNTWDKYYVQTPTGTVVRKEKHNDVETYKAWFDDKGVILRDKRGSIERKYADGKYFVFDNGVLIHSY